MGYALAKERDGFLDFYTPSGTWNREVMCAFDFLTRSEAVSKGRELGVQGAIALDHGSQIARSPSGKFKLACNNVAVIGMVPVNDI